MDQMMTRNSFPRSMMIPPVVIRIDPQLFSHTDLAQHGLLNDSNNCCLVSIVLTFHRLQIWQKLPPSINDLTGTWQMFVRKGIYSRFLNIAKI